MNSITKSLLLSASFLLAGEVNAQPNFRCEDRVEQFKEALICGNMFECDKFGITYNDINNGIAKEKLVIPELPNISNKDDRNTVVEIFDNRLTSLKNILYRPPNIWTILYDPIIQQYECGALVQFQPKQYIIWVGETLFIQEINKGNPQMTSLGITFAHRMYQIAVMGAQGKINQQAIDGWRIHYILNERGINLISINMQ